VTAAPLISRQRLAPLSWAALCLLVVAGFARLVTQDRSPLDSFDFAGRSGEDWADDHAPLVDALRLVEIAFATIGMIILTTIVAGILLVQRRIRAAAFVVVVMVATSLTTGAMKTWLGRGRPDWQDSTDLLTSKSFPSGHASSSAAMAGILIILVWALVHRHVIRWTATILLLFVWVMVSLDRVLLGRHFPTDVIAGSLLGIAVMLIGFALFDPVSEKQPDPDRIPAETMSR